MISEKSIYIVLSATQKRTSMLANPFYNDAGGSKLWSEVNDKLIEILNILKENGVQE